MFTCILRSSVCHQNHMAICMYILRHHIYRKNLAEIMYVFLRSFVYTEPYGIGWIRLWDKLCAENTIMIMYVS